MESPQVQVVEHEISPFPSFRSGFSLYSLQDAYNFVTVAFPSAPDVLRAEDCKQFIYNQERAGYSLR